MGYTERGPCHNGTTACGGGTEALEDAPSNSWSGLRIINATHNIMYAEFRRGSGTDAPIVPSSTNFTYAFDMAADPYQLVNKAEAGSAAPWPKEVLAQLSAELWSVATCVGAECP